MRRAGRPVCGRRRQSPRRQRRDDDARPGDPGDARDRVGGVGADGDHGVDGACTRAHQRRPHQVDGAVALGLGAKEVLGEHVVEREHARHGGGASVVLHVVQERDALAARSLGHPRQLGAESFAERRRGAWQLDEAHARRRRLERARQARLCEDDELAIAFELRQRAHELDRVRLDPASATGQNRDRIDSDAHRLQRRHARR